MTIIAASGRSYNSIQVNFLGLGCHKPLPAKPIATWSNSNVGAASRRDRDLKVAPTSVFSYRFWLGLLIQIRFPRAILLLVNPRPNRPADFQIIGKISHARTFATGSGIREIARLRRVYGEGRWRKRKGITTVLLPDGITRTAEVHWYEASGIGRFECKIKRFID